MGLGEAMVKTFMVEYIMQDETLGKITLTRAMNQIELGKLLLQDGITLCNVDKQNKQAYKRSRRALKSTFKTPEEHHKFLGLVPC